MLDAKRVANLIALEIFVQPVMPFAIPPAMSPTPGIADTKLDAALK